MKRDPRWRLFDEAEIAALIDALAEEEDTDLNIRLHDTLTFELSDIRDRKRPPERQAL